MVTPNQACKKVKVSIADFLITLSIVATPILGALTLIIVFYLTLYSLVVFFKVKYSRGQENFFPFKLLGIIFISYFIYFLLNGFAFEDSVSELKRVIQKIIPILMIGILALTAQGHTFSLNHKFIGFLSTWSLFITFSLATLIYVINPKFEFLGHTLASKADVFDRLEMGTHNPLIFAVIITTLGFLCLLSFEQKTFFEKITSLFILIICIIIAFSWNGSRGPFLVCLPLSIISLWYLQPNIYNFYNQKNKKTFWAISASIIFFSLTSIYLNAELILQNESLMYLLNGISSIFNTTNYDFSMSHRIILWVSSLEALPLRPIFGYGISHKMDAVLPFIENTSNFHTDFLNYNHLHSIYFNHLISGGAFGFVMLIFYFFGIILVIKRAGLRVSRDSKFFIIVILTSLALNGLTNVILMHELLSHFFSMLLLLSLICINNDPKNMKTQS